MLGKGAAEEKAAEVGQGPQVWDLAQPARDSLLAATRAPDAPGASSVSHCLQTRVLDFKTSGPATGPAW